MLYFFIFIALNAVMLRAMDVDTELVQKKRKHEDLSTVDATSSSASSLSSDGFMLSDEQKERCEWAIQETTEQVNALKKYGSLTYPYGTFARAHPAKIERINHKAENVTKNKNILQQNMLIRIANGMALKLHGAHKSEFLGDGTRQDQTLKQVYDDVAKLTTINDALYNRCNEEPTQPLKKQKH